MTIHLIRQGLERVVLLIFCQISVVSIDSCSLNNRCESRAAHIKCSHEESEEVVTETGPISPVATAQHKR